MIKKNTVKLLIILIIPFGFLQMCASDKPVPVLKGPYLGQKPPQDEPELFAPGIVSTGMLERDIAIAPDGNEIYFCVVVGPYAYTAIMFTKLENNRWIEPQVAPFSSNPEYMDLEPFISPDGKKLFFLSNRPDTARGTEIGNQDIWVMERIDNNWSEPYNLGLPINTDNAEFFPSVTQDGTLYFTRAEKGSRTNIIYRSKCVDGKYAEPEKLPETVNSGTNRYNAFIAPDESYIIVPIFGRKDSIGNTDYYICFRDENDIWTEPINLGKKINTPGDGEFSPYVSPNGKYFFFMSSRIIRQKEQLPKLNLDVIWKLYKEPGSGNADIYWIDTSFIEQLKTQESR